MTYEDEPISAFLDAIASKKVVPAGGTAAAVVGAIGTALCEMACVHTVETTGDGSEAWDLDELIADLREQQTELLDLADRDAAAVDALVTASPDQSGRKRATGVPLAIAETCLPVIEAATEITANGNPNAVPDAVTGTYLVHAALEAAVYTVRSNVNEISDPSFTTDVLDRVTEIESTAQTALDRVLTNAEGRS